MKNIQQIIHQKKSLLPWIYLLIFLLIVLAILGYYLLKPEEKIFYETQKPIIGDITQTISATGTLSATNDVTIGSQISGTIYKIYVDVNDAVKKDQILAEINPNKLNQALEGYEAQLKSALANLESSQITLKQKEWTYTRQKRLYQVTKGQSPSQLNLENSRLEYLQAKADVDIKLASINQIQTNINAAKIDLQNSIIRSSIDGIVLTREVSIGQTVAASLNAPTLFTLAENLKDMKLVVNISESDIGKVKENQKVFFSVDAYPDQTFEAKVNRVNFASTTTDNITSYETSIFVNNQDLLLRPGMSATASIQIAEAKNALLIPIAAIFYQPKTPQESKKSSRPLFAPGPPPRQKRTLNQDQSIKGNEARIYILQNNHPTPIMVKVGVQNSKYIQILSPNITKDTLIITDSQ